MSMMAGTVYSLNARKINTGAYKADYASELAGQGTSKLVSAQVKEQKAGSILSKVVPSGLQNLWRNPLVKIAVLGIGGFFVWKFVLSRFVGKKAAKRARAAYARSFVGRRKVVAKR